MQQFSTTAALLLVFSVGIPAGAETIYSVTESTNQIFSFNSATPGKLLTFQNITGLPSGEAINKIDVRPSNGEIYGLYGNLSGGGEIYTINPATGAATLVSTLTFSSPPPDLINTADIDFDPVTGLLRVLGYLPSSSSPENFLVNVDTGQTIAQGPVHLAPGDPQGSGNPFILGVAYSNNVPGATSSSLYMVTTITGAAFVLDIADPNDPTTLHSVGNLGIAGGSGGAMDISGLTGTAYFATFLNPGDNPFYTIDLQTGTATFVGTIDDPRLGNVIGGLSAAETSVPEPAMLLLLGIGFVLLIRVHGRSPAGRASG